MKTAHLVLAGFLLLVLGLILSAQTDDTHTLHLSTQPVKTQLDQVVSRQLAALGRGDFATAYTYASTDIQKLFTREQFEKMVRANYAIMLTQPRADFGLALDDGEQGVLFVEFTGPAGVQVFRYTFVYEELGWKITGVEQVEKADNPRPPLTA